MSPDSPPPSPEQIRAALIAHLARKLGYSGKAVTHLIAPLSNDDIARCLRADAKELRGAVFATVAAAMEHAA